MKLYLRIARHALFLVVALVAGFVGVLWVGVGIMGDNPGALFGGIAVFVLTLLFLAGLEALWVSRFLRGGRLLDVIAECVLALASALGAISGAEAVFWFFVHSSGSEDPTLAAIAGAFSFLALEAVLYTAGQYGIGKFEQILPNLRKGTYLRLRKNRGEGPKTGP